jgi:hypothetical protein
MNLIGEIFPSDLDQRTLKVFKGVFVVFVCAKRCFIIADST